MFSQGVDPKLDFTDMQDIRETYERLTRMHVLLSVSHMQEIWYLQHFQDLIRMLSQKEWHGEKRRKSDTWTVPYLPIDPTGCGKKIRFRCYPHQQPVR